MRTELPGGLSVGLASTVGKSGNILLQLKLWGEPFWLLTLTAVGKSGGYLLWQVVVAYYPNGCYAQWFPSI